MLVQHWLELLVACGILNTTKFDDLPEIYIRTYTHPFFSSLLKDFTGPGYRLPHTRK